MGKVWTDEEIKTEYRRPGRITKADFPEWQAQDIAKERGAEAGENFLRTSQFNPSASRPVPDGITTLNADKFLGYLSKQADIGEGYTFKGAELQDWFDVPDVFGEADFIVRPDKGRMNKINPGYRLDLRLPDGWTVMDNNPQTPYEVDDNVFITPDGEWIPSEAVAAMPELSTIQGKTLYTTPETYHEHKRQEQFIQTYSKAIEAYKDSPLGQYPGLSEYAAFALQSLESPSEELDQRMKWLAWDIEQRGTPEAKQYLETLQLEYDFKRAFPDLEMAKALEPLKTRPDVFNNWMAEGGRTPEKERLLRRLGYQDIAIDDVFGDFKTRNMDIFTAPQGVAESAANKVESNIASLPAPIIYEELVNTLDLIAEHTSDNYIAKHGEDERVEDLVKTFDQGLENAIKRGFVSVHHNPFNGEMLLLPGTKEDLGLTDDEFLSYAKQQALKTEAIRKKHRPSSLKAWGNGVMRGWGNVMSGSVGSLAAATKSESLAKMALNIEEDTAAHYPHTTSEFGTLDWFVNEALAPNIPIIWTNLMVGIATGGVASTAAVPAALTKYSWGAKAGKWVLGALGMTAPQVVSEATLEAGWSFNEVYGKTGSLNAAISAARKVFWQNTGLLGGTETLQWLGTLAPVKGSGLLQKTAVFASKVLWSVGSEGGQEIGQEVFSASASGREFDIFSQEGLEVMTAGGSMGLLFGLPGASMSFIGEGKSDTVNINISEEMMDRLRVKYNALFMDRVEQGYDMVEASSAAFEDLTQTLEGEIFLDEIGEGLATIIEQGQRESIPSEVATSETPGGVPVAPPGQEPGQTPGQVEAEPNVQESGKVDKVEDKVVEPSQEGLQKPTEPARTEVETETSVAIPETPIVQLLRSSAEAQPAVQETLKKQRAARIARKKQVYDELIAQGIDRQEADRIANQELAGKYDKGNIVVPEQLQSPEAIEDLYKQIDEKISDEWEKTATRSALENALRGEPIPQKRGTGSRLFPEGGSAWDRLVYVFGQEFAQTLDTYNADPYVITDGQTVEVLDSDGKPVTGKEGAAKGEEVQVYRRSDLIPADVSPDARAFFNREKTLKEVSNTTIFELHDLLRNKEHSILFGDTDRAALNREVVRRVLLNLLDIANLPRAFLASWDLSAPGRQGLVLSLNHPLVAIDAFGKQLQAFAREDNYIEIAEMIKDDPYYEAVTKEMGVELTDIGKISESRKIQEEAFQSKLASKIPFVRLSERAYVTYLNVLRFNVAKNYYQYLKSREEKGKSVEPAEYKAMGQFINCVSGRGPIGKLGDVAPVVNTTFFSIRLQTGRLATPFLLFNPNIPINSPVRRIMIRELGVFSGFVGSVIGLAIMAGLDVELDPRSSDFGKIRVGNTRYDPFAGFQQYIVLTARMATGQTVTSSGVVRPIDRDELIARFIRSKLSPTAGLITDIKLGETYLGQEFEPADLGTFEQVKERMFPMVVQGFMDAIGQEGGKGAFMAIPEVFGISVLSYETYSERYAKVKQNYIDSHELWVYDENGEQIRHAENWDDLNMVQQHEAKHDPEFEKEMKALQDAMESDGYHGERGWQIYNELDEQRIQRGENLIKEYEDRVIHPENYPDQHGDIPTPKENSDWLKSETWKLKAEIYDRKMQANKDFQLFEDTGELPEDPYDAAIIQYFDIFKQATDPDTGVVRPNDTPKGPGLNTLESELRAKLTEAQNLALDKWITRQQWGPLMQEYEDARHQISLSGYYDAPDGRAFRATNEEVENVLTGHWFNLKPVSKEAYSVKAHWPEEFEAWETGKAEINDMSLDGISRPWTVTADQWNVMTDEQKRTALKDKLFDDIVADNPGFDGAYYKVDGYEKGLPENMIEPHVQVMLDIEDHERNGLNASQAKNKALLNASPEYRKAVYSMDVKDWPAGASDAEINSYVEYMEEDIKRDTSKDKNEDINFYATEQWLYEHGPFYHNVYTNEAKMNQEKIDFNKIPSREFWQWVVQIYSSHPSDDMKNRYIARGDAINNFGADFEDQMETVMGWSEFDWDKYEQYGGKYKIDPNIVFKVDKEPEPPRWQTRPEDINTEVFTDPDMQTLAEKIKTSAQAGRDYFVEKDKEFDEALK